MTLIRRTPFLLYSYLATEMLAPFFASFLIMNCIFFLVKLIPFLDIVLELEIGFNDFIRAFSYLFPNMMLYSIPMSAMMGIIIGFTRLSNDTEILAFKACGISIYSMLPPVILLTLFISIVTAYVSINLIPTGEIAMKQLFYQLTKEKLDRGIKEKQFSAALGDLVVYVEDIDPETFEWKNVWVSDMRGQDIPAITMAQSGKMVTNLTDMTVTIDLFNGSTRRSIANKSDSVKFDNYRVNIPLSLPVSRNTMLKTSSMTMKELLENSRKNATNTEYSKKLLVHFHKRIVLPVGCLIMSLIAIPLGLQSGPGKKALGIPLGLIFFILYYIFFTAGKTIAVEMPLPVGLSMWFPNCVFLLIAAIAIYRTANEKSLVPESLSDRFLTMRQKLFKPK